MSLKHILKHTENEIIFKCYITDPSGGVIDLSLQNDMTTQTQEYVAPTSVQNNINGLPSQIRTELQTELAHVMTLENNPGLTTGQATMLLELYRLAGLDPTRPLIVTQTQRTAGDITQNLSTSPSETVVIRA